MRMLSSTWPYMGEMTMSITWALAPPPRPELALMLMLMIWTVTMLMLLVIKVHMMIWQWYDDDDHTSEHEYSPHPLDGPTWTGTSHTEPQHSRPTPANTSNAIFCILGFIFCISCFKFNIFPIQFKFLCKSYLVFDISYFPFQQCLPLNSTLSMSLTATLPFQYWTTTKKLQKIENMNCGPWDAIAKEAKGHSGFIVYCTSQTDFNLETWRKIIGLI